VDVGICVTDAEGRYLRVNPAYCRIYGYTAEEMLGQDRLMVIPPDRREEGAAEHRAVFAMPTPPAPRERQVVRKDGTRREVSVTFAFLEPPGGGRWLVRAVTDITERKRAEEALRERERFIAGIVRAAPDTLFVFDLAERRVVYNNRQVFDMLGYTPEQLAAMGGDVLPRLIHPEDLPRSFQAVADWADAADGEVRDIEYRIRDARGAWHWFCNYATVFRRDADGRPSQIIGSARDVTERKRAEEALRERERFIDGMVQAQPDILYVFDLAERRVVYTNRHGFPHLGYTFEEIDRLGPEVGPRLIHPEDLPRIEQSLADWADVPNGAVREIEFRIRDKAGAWHWIHNYSMVFQRDAGGRARQVIGSVRDVSERKRAEEEQRRLEEKLRQTQKLESLGVLAGGVAHDFNNLLTAILGYASLAQQEAPPGSPQQSYLDEVLQAGRRAAELCQQMLAYAGRGRFVVGPVDLSRLIEDLSPLLGASLPKLAVLSFQLAPGLPPVEGDAAQLRQVVLNLLLNAAEAVGEGAGAVTVRTRLVRHDAADPGAAFQGAELHDGEYVALEVADTGCGMDGATRQRAFEPFFTTKFTGRGLGLAAVLGIVRSHRGGVRIESEPGRGTTVRVLLPPAAQVPVPAPAPPAAPAGLGLVLFVDDEPQVRALGEAVLRQAGYQVLPAADGQEALELYRRRHAELAAVVLDLTMPRLTGEEALRAMRAVSDRVPVLLSSGYSEQEAGARFPAGGPDAFLSKPYVPRELLEKVRALVRGKGR
jgi:PAS domain S-box-containing protein